MALADVPYLLPTVAIEDVVDGIRTQTERRPDDVQSVAGDYVQFWMLDDGAGQVTIRTHLQGEPTERALEIARSISRVTVDTWNPIARPPEFPPDGCSGFVC